MCLSENPSGSKMSVLFAIIDRLRSCPNVAATEMKEACWSVLKCCVT